MESSSKSRERYNELVDHVGTHGQRRHTEALNKDSLVWKKEYPTESSSKSREIAMQTQAHAQAALQAQLQAQAPAPAPVPQEQGHGGPSIMERFKRMAPPSFKGESQPLLAESWMRTVEKIFRAIRCAEEDKAEERDGSVSRGEEGIAEDVHTTFPAAGQEEGRVPVTAASSGGIQSASSCSTVPRRQA
ncbi:hypothetical protein Taro_042497 [Colocasia esculenta]|uniref:Uncharacterized protein n=1 Tax=Colocasia esculenta TaxID=4460 RepID=A0A843WZP5_COLES|nr:hypothetical protein [Colocasia esculenta]